MTTDEAITLLLAQLPEMWSDQHRALGEMLGKKESLTDSEITVLGWKTMALMHRTTLTALTVIALNRVADDRFAAELAVALEDPDFLGDWIQGIAVRRGGEL